MELKLNKSFVAACILFFITVVGTAYMLGNNKFETLSDIKKVTTLSSIDECINNTIKITKPKKIDDLFINASTEQCYVKIVKQGYLNDFHIRRLKFYQQAYDELAILWMVIIVTLSSVVLAGLQIFVSYRLASIGKGDFNNSSELLIENNKLSLKSSITGVFILFLSFAFFFVFVDQMYQINEINEKNPASDKATENPKPSTEPQQTTVGIIENPKPSTGAIETSKPSTEPQQTAIEKLKEKAKSHLEKGITNLKSTINKGQ